MMKKRIPTFLSGVLAAALVFSLGLTALAVSGQAQFGLFGISMLGKEVVAAGETIAGENGAEAPVVVTYTDEKGGSTNYIAVRKVAELFDSPIAWDSENNCVAIAPPGETVITVGETEAARDRKLPSIPEYGVAAGPITEIDPATLGNKMPSYNNDEVRYQAKFGISMPRLTPRSDVDGDYMLTFINNSECDVMVSVERSSPMGHYSGRSFTSIRLAAGESIDRAFHVETGSSPLAYGIDATVRAVFLSDDNSQSTFDQPIDVTIITKEEYR